MVLIESEIKTKKADPFNAIEGEAVRSLYPCPTQDAKNWLEVTALQVEPIDWSLTKDVYKHFDEIRSKYPQEQMLSPVSIILEAIKLNKLAVMYQQTIPAPEGSVDTTNDSVSATEKLSEERVYEDKIVEVSCHEDAAFVNDLFDLIDYSADQLVPLKAQLQRTLKSGGLSIKGLFLRVEKATAEVTPQPVNTVIPQQESLSNTYSDSADAIRARQQFFLGPVNLN